MNAAADSIAPLIARLTQPGAPFELSEVNVSGRMMRAYKNAPATLPDLINAARAHGAKEFIAYQGERWSFARLLGMADAIAHQLVHRTGVRKGDRVAIAMRNRPEWAVALVAAVLVGALPAPLNSFGTGPELRAVIEFLEPKVLFCVDGYMYGGKPFDRRGELAEIIGALTVVAGVVIVLIGR